MIQSTEMPSEGPPNKPPGATTWNRLKWIVALVVVALTAYSCWQYSRPSHVAEQPVPKKETILFIGGSREKDRRADIVFVHGLDGDADGTWRSLAPPYFWPEKLSKQFPDMGVWSINYGSNSTEWLGGAMPLLDRSKNLLESMRLDGIGDRPMIFVGHSLGGIVIKQMLRDADSQNNKEWEPVAKNTKGVAFLATPHNGSDLSNLISSLTKMSNAFTLIRPSNATRELERNASTLRDLNIWYRNNVSRLGIKTAVLFETQPLAPPMPPVVVVDQGSSDPGISEVTPIAIAANHISICKVGSSDELVYKKVADLIVRSTADLGPWNITFSQFVSEFNDVRHDASRLAAFKKDNVGRTVRWTAVITAIHPDATQPAYEISSDINTPSQDRVVANFSPSDFRVSLRVDTRVTIHGVFSSTTNENGAILRDCKVEVIRSDSP